MATLRLTPEQIAQVSGLVFQYITAQRQKYGSRAIPLSAQQKAAMAGFFSPQVLEPYLLGTMIDLAAGRSIKGGSRSSSRRRFSKLYSVSLI